MVDTLSTALAKQGMAMKSIERWKAEMPTEQEMLPRDKYTMFDRKAKRYRKGIHSMYMVLEKAVQRRETEWPLTHSQSCPSGQECRRESTRPVTKQTNDMHRCM